MGLPARLGAAGASAMRSTPAIDRALRRIQVHPLGCWIYMGRLNRGGYGVIGQRRGEGWLVHRLVYEDFLGPIPEGLDLDHLCFTPACCNPAHLEPVTRAENTRRQWLAGRGAAHVNAAKTHCPRGHLYDAENTRVKPSDGRRRCRTCMQEQRRAYRARLRARKDLTEVAR